jgi:hypothetical protein
MLNLHKKAVLLTAFMDIGMIIGNRIASSYKFRLLTNAGNSIKTAPIYCPKKPANPSPDLVCRSIICPPLQGA